MFVRFLKLVVLSRCSFSIGLSEAKDFHPRRMCCIATPWKQPSHIENSQHLKQASYNKNSQHLKQALCHRNPPAIFSSAAKTVLLQEGHSDDIFVCRTILNPKDGDHENLSVFCSSSKFYLNLSCSIVLRWLAEGTFKASGCFPCEARYKHARTTY